MCLIDLTKLYFHTFSNKDLVGLEKMFARDVCLRDWEIQAIGIEEVLKANQRIFDSVDSIDVKPTRMYRDGKTVIAELKVDINNGEVLLSVVDIIQITEESLIGDIRAYKG